MQTPPTTATKRCPKCKEIKERSEFRPNRSRSDGLQTYCRPCQVEHNNRSEAGKRARKKQKAKVRRLALEHYSNGTPMCACCGESEIMFLAIDHVVNNGAEERRTLKKGTGHQFAQYLKSQGYPPGYQVLCHNCNMAKGAYGQCPHKGVGEIFYA